MEFDNCVKCGARFRKKAWDQKYCSPTCKSPTVLPRKCKRKSCKKLFTPPQNSKQYCCLWCSANRHR